MQKHSFLKFITGLLISFVVISCNKPDEVVLANEGTVYMPQAVGTRSKIDLQLSATTPQEVVFGAAYGGLNYSTTDNQITFQVEPAKVATYNSANGTTYTLLPATSYDIKGLTTTIASGSISSTPLSFSVKTNTITPGVRYLLPITLTSSTNGAIDPTLQTTYFRFDTLIRKSVDVTGMGTITVSKENGGGPGANEGSPKLVDNDANTKYLFSGFPAATGAWFQLQFSAPVAVGAYTFTSANDSPDRDPRDWKLQGSDNGTTWTDIDNRVNQFFPARTTLRRFEVPGTPQAYTYYRVSVSALNSSNPNLFQMAEWRLIKYE